MWFQMSCLIDIVSVTDRRLLSTAEVSVNSAGAPIEVTGAGVEVSTPLPYNLAMRAKKKVGCLSGVKNRSLDTGTDSRLRF